MKERRSLFDHLKGVTSEKIAWESLSEDDKKTFDVFMVNRWLSMERSLTPLIDTLQQYQGSMPKEVVYKLYLDILPNQYFFFNFTKKNKKHRYDKGLIDLVRLHFSVSFIEAVEYISLFASSADGLRELKQILDMYPLTDDDQKKFFRTVL